MQVDEPLVLIPHKPGTDEVFRGAYWRRRSLGQAGHERACVGEEALSLRPSGSYNPSLLVPLARSGIRVAQLTIKYAHRKARMLEPLASLGVLACVQKRARAGGRLATRAAS